MFLFCFCFFCISPSAYFCHIVKLLIKKETTRSFPTVFFLLSLPVSVGLITTNYSQQPLSSLLKIQVSKRQALWMIKPRGPSQAASEPEPSLTESMLPAENQLALVSKRPTSNTERKAPFHPKCHWDVKAEKSYLQTRRQGSRGPCLAACFIPTSRSYQCIPSMRGKVQMGHANKVDKLAGWIFSGQSGCHSSSGLVKELCSFCNWSLFLCILYSKVSALIFPPRGATFISSCHILTTQTSHLKPRPTWKCSWGQNENAHFMLHMWPTAGFTPMYSTFSFISYLTAICLKATEAHFQQCDF